MKQFLKSTKEKIKKWLERKRDERSFTLFDKIYREFPELKHAAAIPEQLRLISMYYEMRMVKSQRFYNRIMVILTLIIIYLTFFKF